MEGNIDLAEDIRLKTIPDKLYKFISLDGSEYDAKKFETLQTGCLWFCGADMMNDPYEHKGMKIDRDMLYAAGIPHEVISGLEGIFDTRDYEMVSLSASDYNNLPLWAYYTNGSRGYCVEYNVVNKNAIHEVLYEKEKVIVGKLLIEAVQYAKRAMSGDRTAKDKADSYLKILMQNMFLKDLSWSHEKEYRIVHPILKCAGENIPINCVGLQVSRIISGLNCASSDKEKLNEISNSMGCGDIFCAILSDNTFGLDLVKYDK